MEFCWQRWSYLNVSLTKGRSCNVGCSDRIFSGIRFLYCQKKVSKIAQIKIPMIFILEDLLKRVHDGFHIVCSWTVDEGNLLPCHSYTKLPVLKKAFSNKKNQFSNFNISTSIGWLPPSSISRTSGFPTSMATPLSLFKKTKMIKQCL